jgi:hypothetical protein
MTDKRLFSTKRRNTQKRSFARVKKVRVRFILFTELRTERLVRVLFPFKGLISNTLLSLTGGDSNGRMVCDSHNDIPEPGEHFTLLWLGEEVGDHFASWAIDEADISFVNLVLDEEISDVYVTRSLPRGLSTVLLHLHRTLIVLVKLAVVNDISLGLNKIHGPNGLW